MRVCYTSSCSPTTTNEVPDIAFASTAIKTQDVHGSSFRYAKVMTLPFFGSGMVEIPPDGYKRMKNSRKMQMVFFVHEGKVTVDIEDVQFGMTKGGVWQVPRGEFSFSFFHSFRRFVPHRFISSCLCIIAKGTEQRSEMQSSPQQCNRQASCKDSIHTDYVRV